MAIFNLNNEYERLSFKKYVNDIFGTREVVEVKKKHKARSLSQNSYLHVLLGYFASEFGFTIEEVKMDIFKKEVNRDIFKAERKNKRGQQVVYMRSSSELDTREMTDAIERFRNYSSAVCGLYLPAPNEYEALIAAQQQIELFKEYL